MLDELSPNGVNLVDRVKQSVKYLFEGTAEIVEIIRY